MKELKEKKHLIIGVLTVLILFVVIFKFAYKPVANKKAEVQNEIDLKSDNKEINLEDLKNELETETQRADNAEKELNKLYKVKQFGYLDYTQMMEYLGERANQYDVDIITLKKEEVRDSGDGQKYEVPYYVNLKGTYENLLLFIDSLYQIDNYMEIQAFRLNQRPSSEQKETVTNDNSESYKQWMQTFSERLNKDLSEMGKANNISQDKKQDEANNEVNSEVKEEEQTKGQGEKYYEEFQKQLENDTNILDLEIEFFFITLDRIAP